MKPKFEKMSDYFYKGTYVLKNNLEIKDEEQLNIFERKYTSLRIAKITDPEVKHSPIQGNFDFNHYKQIHHYIFQDIYPWAGELRKCEINKSVIFCLFNFIDELAADYFNGLKYENYYIEYDEATKIAKLVELFGNLNALHPFREGNGRTQRIFIETLAKINGLNLDLTEISQQDMINASFESINGNDSKLFELFNKCNKHEELDEQILKERQLENIRKYCNPELAQELCEIALMNKKNRR